MGSSKKTPAKPGKTAVQARRSLNKAGSPPSTPTPAPKKTPTARKRRGEKEWNYTHHLPTEEERIKNGRKEGRNLICWSRPRMAEKLLLHIQYECARYKIDLPLDSIAHRLNPGSSGQAIAQHLVRLRPMLIAEGHLVPPIPQKPGSRLFIDPAIRGYVRRDQQSDDTTSVRPVLYSERHEDRKFNLPDAYDVQRKGNRGDPDSADQQLSMAADPANLTPGATYEEQSNASMVHYRPATRGAVPQRSYIEGEDDQEGDEEEHETEHEFHNTDDSSYADQDDDSTDQIFYSSPACIKQNSSPPAAAAHEAKNGRAYPAAVHGFNISHGNGVYPGHGGYYNGPPPSQNGYDSYTGAHGYNAGFAGNPYRNHSSLHAHASSSSDNEATVTGASQQASTGREQGRFNQPDPNFDPKEYEIGDEED